MSKVEVERGNKLKNYYSSLVYSRLRQTQIKTIMNQALKYATDQRNRFIDELKHILRIPSISTLSKHKSDMQRMAEWLKVHLLEIGMERAELLPTKGYPIVYGEWMKAENKPTLLIYGHYDVQPVDPIDEWQSQPFEPTIKDDYIYARGASDNKSQIFTHLKAIQSYMRTHKELPINIKLMIEGEEELGSENLEDFIKDNKELLHSDNAVIPDTDMPAPDKPMIYTSLRGLIYYQVDIQTAEHDLHSGIYGGGAGNAATVLANALAKLKDDQQRIQIPGFYDDVVNVSKQEIESLWGNKAEFEKNSKAFMFVSEKDVESHLMPLVRPSLDINGIESGFTEEGSKTVIPARAMAKISMRLVAHQDPDKICKAFEKYFKSLLPKKVKVDFQHMGSANPVLVKTDSPAIAAAVKSLEASFNGKVNFSREGASIPVVEMLQRLTGLEGIMMGYSLPGDNLHAPNERYFLPNFYNGIDNNIRFYEYLGEV